MNETVLIVGATSGIARPLCRRMAARGCTLVLAGRDRAELDSLAADLRMRHSCRTFVEPFDALDFDGHASFFERCVERTGDALDGIVVCHGYLPVQSVAEHDLAETRRTLDVNYTSVVTLLTPAANWFEERKRGWIAVISSVAGDRGRQSNYIYGSAKAGVTAFLQGLRNRLHRSGVAVITIKPGYVATRMTAGRVDTGSLLVASPERVARDIDRAIRRRRNVAYTPSYWRCILGTVRLIPEWLFKRLKT